MPLITFDKSMSFFNLIELSSSESDTDISDLLLISSNSISISLPATSFMIGFLNALVLISFDFNSLVFLDIVYSYDIFEPCFNKKNN